MIPNEVTDGEQTVYVLLHGAIDFSLVCILSTEEQALAWKEVLSREQTSLEYYVEEIQVLREDVRPTILVLYNAIYRGTLEGYQGIPSATNQERVIRELDYRKPEELNPARIRWEYEYEVPALAGQWVISTEGTDPREVLRCLHERMMELRKERNIEGDLACPTEATWYAS